MVLSKKSQRIFDKFRKEAIALKKLLIAQGIQVQSDCQKREQDRQRITYYNNFIQNMNENLPENEKHCVTSNELSCYIKDLPPYLERGNQSDVEIISSESSDNDSSVRDFPAHKAIDDAITSITVDSMQLNAASTKDTLDNATEKQSNSSIVILDEDEQDNTLEEDGSIEEDEHTKWANNLSNEELYKEEPIGNSMLRKRRSMIKVAEAHSAKTKLHKSCDEIANLPDDESRSIWNCSNIQTAMKDKRIEELEKQVVDLKQKLQSANKENKKLKTLLYRSKVKVNPALTESDKDKKPEDYQRREQRHRAKMEVYTANPNTNFNLEEIERKMSVKCEIEDASYLETVVKWKETIEQFVNKKFEAYLFFEVYNGRLLKNFKDEKGGYRHSSYLKINSDILKGRYLTKEFSKKKINAKSEKQVSDLVQTMFNFLNLPVREEMLWINRKGIHEQEMISANKRYSAKCSDPVLSTNPHNDFKIRLTNEHIDDKWMASVSTNQICIHCKCDIKAKYEGKSDDGKSDFFKPPRVVACEHLKICENLVKAFPFTDPQVQVNPALGANLENDSSYAVTLPMQSNYSIRFLNAFRMEWKFLENLIAGVLDADESKGDHLVYMIFDLDSLVPLYAGKTSSKRDTSLFAFTNKIPTAIWKRMNCHLGASSSYGLYSPIHDYVKETNRGLVTIVVAELISDKLASYLESIIQWHLNPKHTVMMAIEFPQGPCNYKGRDGKWLSHKDMEYVAAGLVLRSMKSALRLEFKPKDS